MAGGVAAAVSGIPSTAHALVTGRDPLEATMAAGTLPLPGETRRGRLVLAAGPVHLAVAVAWGIVLARALPPKPTLFAGAAAGLAIAAFDLGTVGRLFPRIRALPLLPQLADHALYGVTAAAVLRRRA